MLSILIPTYNYNAYPLAVELERQALKTGIIFELICIDDGSSSPLNIQNKNINSLPNCQFIEGKQNRGRTGVRQYLADQARYDWLIFLDADVMPKSDNYIQNYVDFLSKKYDAIYGGFAYKSENLNEEYALRWTFGKAKEEVDANIRNQKPYKIVISGNFLTQKRVFMFLNSKIKGNNYGYDNYFGALLKTHGCKVKHINNEVYHLGLDKNATYLKKVEQSVDTLLKLYKKNDIIESDNDLLKAFIFLKKLKLHYLMSFIFKRTKVTITKNLLSARPSIRALQFYKLSYICFKDFN